MKVKMKAVKLSEKIEILPEQVKYYMYKGYTILDDNGEYLGDPIGYADKLLKNQAKNQTVEIPLGDFEKLPSLMQELKQAKADIEYMSMVSGIDLEEG